jgi:hypothetical protein
MEDRLKYSREVVWGLETSDARNHGLEFPQLLVAFRDLAKGFFGLNS